MDDQDRREDIKQEVRKRLAELDRSLRRKTGEEKQQISAEEGAEEAEHQLRKKDRSAQKNVWRAFERGRISRRDFLKLLGVTTVSGIAATGIGWTMKDYFPANPTGHAAANTVNLADEGLSDGDDISSFFGKIQDDTKYIVPQGDYTFSGGKIDGNNWELVAPDCATITPNGVSRITLEGSNWRFGGFVFGTTGSKEMIVQTGGSDWVVGNCAWAGKRQDQPDYNILPRCDAGSKGVFDRLWLGAGLEHGATENSVKMYKGCHGTVTFRRSYFYHQGAYATETAKSAGSKGKIEFEQCYMHNTEHLMYRVGSPAKKTVNLRDCVGIYDSKEDTFAGRSPGRGARCLWTFWGDTRAKNCDFLAGFDGAIAINRSGEKWVHTAGKVYVDGGNVVGPVDDGVEMNNVGDNPSKEPPEGVPTSIEDLCGTEFSGELSGSSGTSSTSKSPC